MSNEIPHIEIGLPNYRGIPENFNILTIQNEHSLIGFN